MGNTATSELSFLYAGPRTAGRWLRRNLERHRAILITNGMPEVVAGAVSDENLNGQPLAALPNPILQ